MHYFKTMKEKGCGDLIPLKQRFPHLYLFLSWNQQHDDRWRSYGLNPEIKKRISDVGYALHKEYVELLKDLKRYNIVFDAFSNLKRYEIHNKQYVDLYDFMAKFEDKQEILPVSFVVAVETCYQWESVLAKEMNIGE